MKIAGIVAEFNPMHNGHAYLISQAKQMGAECVIASLSGNFVQRSAPALISKNARAEAALRCGVDLCLELPVPYAVSTAQNFAYGSVYALINAGADTIVFGSESADTAKLEAVADTLLGDDFKLQLEKHLSTGCSFPAARQSAVADLLGQDTAKLLENPNDNLGIEYILAAKKLGANVKFMAVKRIGAEHDSTESDEICPSASYIRNLIKTGQTEEIKKFMPSPAYDILQREIALGRISDIDRLETAILARLRSMTDSDYTALPDLSEGIENRLIKAVTEAATLDEVYELAKTKRYSHARIRRLVLSAFLGIDNCFFLNPPPYVRVLGHTEAGRKQLKQGFKNVTTFSRAGEIMDQKDINCVKMFELECRVADLYELSLEKPGRCGTEFTNKLIVL